MLRPLREGWLVPETERMAVWLKVYKGREIQNEICEAGSVVDHTIL